MQPPIDTPPVIYAPPTLPYATPDSLALPADWTSIETFTLDPALRTKVVLIIASLNALLRLLFLAAIFIVTHYILAVDHLTQTMLVIVLTLLSILGTLRGFFRSRRIWNSYRLTLADQGLITRAAGHPDTRIDAPDIAHLTRVWSGYKITLTTRRHHTISRFVTNPAALDAKLQKLRPLDARRGPLPALAFLAFTWLVAILTVILFYVGLYSHNPRTVLACTLLSIPIIIFTLFRTFRIKGLPLRTRISILLQILFPLILLAHWLFLLHFPPNPTPLQSRSKDEAFQVSSFEFQNKLLSRNSKLET